MDALDGVEELAAGAACASLALDESEEVLARAGRVDDQLARRGREGLAKVVVIRPQRVRVALLGLLLALAAANKFRFVPALRSGDPSAARHLSQSIAVEWLIISAVLGTTAVLTTNLALPV